MRLMLETADFGAVDVALADTTAARVGDVATLGIRPEDCAIVAPSDSGVRVSVRLVEQLGDETLLEVMTAGGDVLVVKAPPSQSVRAGETVCLHPLPEGLHVFDAAGNGFPRARVHKG